MKRLAGKSVVITGGAGVIGRAAIRLFLDEGARVLAVDIDAARTDQLAQEIGDNQLTTCIADVTTPSGTEAYVDTAMRCFGGIDVFLNNAGIGGIVQPVGDYPLELFDQIMAVNVRAVWLGLKSVVPLMTTAGSGSIVISSSIMGLKGFPGLSPYVTSKHAVVGMMKAVALECAAAGVRINTIHPAPINSTMMQAFEAGVAGGDVAAGREFITGIIPAGRYGQPDEVAKIMLFLASDDSRYCTGGEYQVDGAMGAG